MYRQNMEKIRACVDCYDDRQMKGRFYDTQTAEGKNFESLMSLLLQIQSTLDREKRPQAFNELRAFVPITSVEETFAESSAPLKGERLTFDISILFRQNTSWQGTVSCLEKKTEAPFRSTLELLFLMDSVLENAS